MIDIPASLLALMSELVRRLPRSVIDKLALVAGRADDPTVTHNALLRECQSLTPENQATVRELLLSWRDSAPTLTGETLATALAAMAWQDDAARRRQQAELVWTGPAILGHGFRSTEQRIVELIDSATRSVWIVAFAAYRVPSVVAALERALARGVRLSFVVEDADESRGRVSFDPIRAFGRTIAEAARVYTWPLDRRPRDNRGRYGTLHAKCVLVDGAAIYVSSANFTEFAMNLNVELGALITSADVAGSAERLLEKLVSDGVLL